MGIQITNRGSTTPFVFGADLEQPSDWTCRIEVKRFNRNVSTIDREIELENCKFPGFLTVAEVEALAFAGTTPVTTGLYRIIGILTNKLTGELKQDIIRFNLADKWKN